MTNRLDTVLVLGAGTMGQQIAAHCLISGKDTRIHDVHPRGGLHPRVIEQIALQTDDAAEQQRRRRVLRQAVITTDAPAAARDVDLLIECVPEDIALKRRVLHEFGRLCPQHTVFTTNTSTFVPSAMARVVPHPERFAAMHFFPGVPLGELMAHARTAPETMQRLKTFLADIGHDVIVCRKESAGAVINAMLIPWLDAALSVAAKGLAEPAEVDAAWKTFTGSRQGPFELLDAIGLDTALQIGGQVNTDSPVDQDQTNSLPLMYLKSCVDAGRLGIKSGCGFYRYDVPAEPPDSSPSAPSCSLLSPARENEDGTFEIDLTLDGTRDAFLKDHLFRRQPLLPGAAVIELFCHAVAQASGRMATELQNIRFLSGLRCFRQNPEQATVRVRRDDQRWIAELRHVYRNRSGHVLDPSRLCASAVVCTEPPPTEPARPDHTTASGWHTIEYLTGRTVELGRSMQCLRRLTLSDENTGCAEILAGYREVDDPSRIPAIFHRTVSLIDAAFVACNFFTQHRLSDALQLPVSITRFRRGPVPPADTVCRMNYECCLAGDKTSQFRFTVFSDNRIVIDVDGYHCHVLAGDSISRLVPE